MSIGVSTTFKMPTRYWVPLGESYSDDRGYLLDPDAFPLLNTNLRTLEQLVEEPCLLLLGEPGIGKSTVLRDQPVDARLPHGSELRRRLDLKSVDSMGLDSDLFRANWYAAWRQGQHQLTLWLDSLDECLGRVEHITSKIMSRFEELDETERQRLKLRIACRTGQHPASLPDSLNRIWPDRLRVYELVPMHRRDVEAQVRARRPRDADRFLRDVEERQLGPLASRPITLNLLLRITDGRALPANRAEIYQRGCEALCNEPDSDRRSLDRQRRRIDTVARMQIAALLAAATVLTHRLTIVVVDTQAGSPPAQSIPLRELLLDGCSLFSAPMQWREPEFLEVLTDTGLFTAGAPGCMVWQHQTYAEYLAARWLASQPFNDIERLRLLSAPTSEVAEGWLVVKSQREVAAWLARMRPSVCERLIRQQPTLLLGSDMALADDPGRALLCQSLLTEYAGGYRLDYSYQPDDYRGLSHPELAEQLHPYLCDKTVCPPAREVAILIAWGCKVQGAVTDLMSIACSEDESPDLRAFAVRGLVAWTDAATTQLLRPLLDLDRSADPHDDIAGSVLQALWSHQLLSPDDALRQLRLPRRVSYIGSYNAFHQELGRTWPPDALPIALEWAFRQPHLRNLPDCTGELLLAFAQRAVRNLEVPGVLSALARLCIHRLLLDEDPFRGAEYTLSSKFDFPSDQTRRQLIRAILQAPEFDNSVVYRWSFSGAYWLCKEDADWLLHELRIADREHEPRWIELLREFCHAYLGPPPDAVIAAAEEIPSLYAAFEYWLQPVVIDSDHARALRSQNQQREARLREQKREQDEADRPAVCRRIKKYISDAILDAQREGEPVWSWIAKLVVNEDGALYLLASLQQRGGRLGIAWAELGELGQRQVTDAAMKYLLDASPEGEPVAYPHPGHVQLSASCWLGFAALRLLHETNEPQLDSLPSSLWERWAATILRFPWASGWRGRARLWSLAYSRAAAACLEAIPALLDDLEVPNRAQQFSVLLDLNREQAEPVCSVLLEWAMRRRAAGLPVGELFDVLVALQAPQALDWVAAQVRPPIAVDTATRASATAAGRALLCCARPPAWHLIRPLLAVDEPLLLEILQAADFISGGSREGTWLSQMGEEDLADLYIVLRRHYPGDEDAQVFEDEKEERPSAAPRVYRQAHLLGPRRCMYRLRDNALRELATRTTTSAIEAIHRLVQTLPEQESLQWVLERRRDALDNRLHGESLQTLDALSLRITSLRKVARDLLRASLPTDADLNAFAHDHFPEVHHRFTDNMDGLKKLDMLIESAEPDTLSAALQQYELS